METMNIITEAGVDLQLAATPGVMWATHDDLCDCTFQRIGFWTNPYMGATMLTRLCCMWKKLNEMFPGMVQEIPAFYNYNAGSYVEVGPQEWNGDSDMPRAVWYRHLAAKTGLSLEQIRQEYANQEPPKAITKG